LGRQFGMETEWRCIAGAAADLLPQHGRYADLCIVGHHPSAVNAPSDYSLSEKLLFVTRLPVLFVPPGEHLATLGRQIVVAWNSGRAAARAVHDAMPLFERAERTTVITINAADIADRNGALPTEQLVQHLGRHSVKCDLAQLEGVAASAIADELQASAKKFDADLLVAGAFGHPKSWERLFVGITRDLLDRMTLPTLMSN
jgi:nucleotide-binding universal stress UspA family protein